jgi:hypothetical protein
MIVSRAGLVVVVSSVAVVLAGCGGSHHKAQTTPPSSPPSTASSSPSAPPAPPINPLTGGAPSPNAVAAVKIDDTSDGRPQMGIEAADIVYVEQVEGGLTRLLAVYNTKLPTVEPIRSTRVGDPDIAMQYGPIAYVASGGSLGELEPMDKSSLRSAINDRGAAGFDRDSNRSVPFNLSANLAAIAARLKSPKAKDIGLVWSKPVVNAGSRPGSAVNTTVGATRVVFNWDAKSGRYVRVIDGVTQHAASGAAVATPNVIVQSCQVTTFDGDIDQSGNPAKVSHTVGQG